MGSGFAKRKKQAKAMQAQFLKMQEELSASEFEGSAGNGLVTLKLNGDHEMLDLKIKPDCVDPEDVEGLEDLIRAAYADATAKLKEKMPGGNDLGGLGGLF